MYVYVLICYMHICPCAIQPVLRECDTVQWIRHRGRALEDHPGPLWFGALWAPWALVGQALVGPWALVGQALVGVIGLLWAGPLWTTLGPRGLGPCGLPGPLWARPFWAPWTLVGRSLVGPLGPVG